MLAELALIQAQETFGRLGDHAGQPVLGDWERDLEIVTEAIGESDPRRPFK